MTDKPKDIKVLWKEEVRGMSLGEKWFSPKLEIHLEENLLVLQLRVTIRETKGF